MRKEIIKYQNENIQFDIKRYCIQLNELNTSRFILSHNDVYGTQMWDFKDTTRHYFLLDCDTVPIGEWYKFFGTLAHQLKIKLNTEKEYINVLELIIISIIEHYKNHE